MRKLQTKMKWMLCGLILAGILSGQAEAAQYSSVNDYYDAIKENERVYDFAGILTESEEDTIREELAESVKKSKLDLVIVTVDENFGYRQQTLADDFYDAGGFGYEENIEHASGVLLLVDMDDRQLYISTAGIGIFYFNDEIIDDILDDIAGYATDGDYEEMCLTFLNQVVDYVKDTKHTDEYEEVIEAWYSGEYQDYGELYECMSDEIDSFRKESFFTLFQNPLIDFIIGAVVALIVVLALKNPKGVRMTVNNHTYRKKDELELLAKEDRFLRRTTVTHKIESSSGSGGSGGGGSFHSSSGGSSHGGGGRGF